MRRILTVICISIVSFVFGQDKGDFKVSLQTGKNWYSMEQFNDLLNDTLIFWNGYYTDLGSGAINTGYSFQANITYQPTSFFDVGVYGGYQLGNSEIAGYEMWLDGFDADTAEIEKKRKFKSDAYHFGLTSTFHVSKLLKFDQKSNFLSRILLGMEVNMGVGFATLSDRESLDYRLNGESLLQSEDYNFRHKSTSFHSALVLKLGYKLSKNDFLSSIGMKIGYQYFKTGTVENEVGSDLYTYDSEEQTTNLDFSGLVIGAFIELGK